MVNNQRPRVCLIGTGNVATHLAEALDKVADIVQVYSRSIENARSLAFQLSSNPSPVNSLETVVDDADYYIVSVKDDAIESVASETPRAGGIWAHTSGSVSMDVFKPYKKRYGVFYPLQTFSKDISLDLKRVPMFIEGCSEEVFTALFDLAQKISDTVEYADSNHRQALHIAAVFACNFVNFMWMQADDLLRNQNLDITFLKPLLEETLRKLDAGSPRDVQTGPARRGDLNIINKHISHLSPEKAEIYSFLTDRILKSFGNE